MHSRRPYSVLTARCLTHCESSKLTPSHGVLGDCTARTQWCCIDLFCLKISRRFWVLNFWLNYNMSGLGILLHWARSCPKCPHTTICSCQIARHWFSSLMVQFISHYNTVEFCYVFIENIFTLGLDICMPEAIFDNDLRKSKLMKGKALRKHSLHEKTAASVLLKLFISGKEWCHTTDAP